MQSDELMSQCNQKCSVWIRAKKYRSLIAVNKTGTLKDVRCDAGMVKGGRICISLTRESGSDSKQVTRSKEVAVRKLDLGQEVFGGMVTLSSENESNFKLRRRHRWPHGASAHKAP